MAAHTQAAHTQAPPAADGAVASAVIARIEKEEGVPADTARLWFDEMLCFLALVGARAHLPRPKQQVVPSLAVDAAWHAFILHTRAYSDYCERHYGCYLHHEPTPPSPAGTDPGGPEARSAHIEGLYGYLLTRVLMQERNGELDETLWPAP